MLANIETFDFEEAFIRTYFYNHFPDTDDEDGPESNDFHRGYAETYVFGTQQNGVLGFGSWRVVFASPKHDPLVFSVQTTDFILILVEPGFESVEMELAEGTLNKEPCLILIAKFKYRDGIERKIISLGKNEDSVEIPNETLQ